MVLAADHHSMEQKFGRIVESPRKEKVGIEVVICIRLLLLLLLALH